jgi:hypothetical protein
MLAWYLAGAAGMGAAALVLGQTGERPLQKIFGTAPAKGGTAKPAEDTRRKAEIDVELAWLADPITFPYFLEAHADTTTLSVRGYVPDKTVRDHALKLARLHTPFTVVDALKEHPSLLVRPNRETPTQLQTAVGYALKEALPRHAQRLQIECAADGTVTLRGPLPSVEEKLAASHALRRLYGCTRVQNLTQVAGTPDVAQVKPSPLPRDDTKESTTPVATIGGPVLSKDTAKVQPKSEPIAAPKKDEAVKPPVVPVVAPPMEKESPTAAPKLAFSAEKTSKLQKRILELCPGAKDVKIEAAPMNKVRIELTVRSDDQITPFAGKIYSIPELVEMRDEVELHFTVGQ